MLNLVDYDGESDEDSPRRKSFSESKKPRLSPEPSASTSPSNADSQRRKSPSPGDDDRFYERSVSRSPPIIQDDFSTTRDGESQFNTPDAKEVNEEPKPPARVSQDDQSDEEERLIDLALQQGKEIIEQMDESSPGNSTPTHIDVDILDDDLEKNATPERLDDNEIKMPPAPDGEVDPALQERFEKAFLQKEAGVNLNAAIQGRQDFGNPMSYEQFIELFDIDEKGTNFSKNVFDPLCFPENCLYKSIAQDQKNIMNAKGDKTTKTK